MTIEMIDYAFSAMENLAYSSIVLLVFMLFLFGICGFMLCKIFLDWSNDAVKTQEKKAKRLEDIESRLSNIEKK